MRAARDDGLQTPFAAGGPLLVAIVSKTIPLDFGKGGTHHLVRPEKGAHGLLLMRLALRRAKLLDQLISRPAAALPAVLAQHAAPLADDDGHGPLLQHVPSARRHAVQLVPRLAGNLLGRLVLVLVAEAPVVMRIDNDRRRSRAQVDRVDALRVVDALFQIPRVGNVDGQGGIDCLDSVDHAIVPLPQPARLPLGLVAHLEPQHAVAKAARVVGNLARYVLETLPALLPQVPAPAPPVLRLAAVGAAVLAAVGAAGDAVQVNQHADASALCTRDNVLDRAPRVDVHSADAGEGRVGAKVGAQRPVADGQANGIDFGFIDQPVQVRVGQRVGPVLLELFACAVNAEQLDEVLRAGELGRLLFGEPREEVWVQPALEAKDGAQVRAMLIAVAEDVDGGCGVQIAFAVG